MTLTTFSKEGLFMWFEKRDKKRDTRECGLRAGGKEPQAPGRQDPAHALRRPRHVTRHVTRDPPQAAPHGRCEPWQVRAMGGVSPEPWRGRLRQGEGTVTRSLLPPWPVSAVRGRQHPGEDHLCVWPAPA